MLFEHDVWRVQQSRYDCLFAVDVSNLVLEWNSFGENEKKRKLQEGKKDVGKGEDEAPILSDRKVMSIEKMMADNDALLTPNFKVAM